MNIASVKTSYFEPWLQFQHPIVRQLAFVLLVQIYFANYQKFSIQHDFKLQPTEVWEEHFQNYLPRLKELDQSPEPLIQFYLNLKVHV